MKPLVTKSRNFAPGPTPLLPAAQMAAFSADLHHRTDEFRRYTRETLEGLQYVLDTKSTVVLFSASGTGAMEAAWVNLLSPGDRALVLTAGKFGERWLNLARVYGIEATKIEAPYGQTIPLGQVEKQLSAAKPYRAVFMQATETSTGVSHDVEGVAKLVRPHEQTCQVVDAITGDGTMESRPDLWGLDILIGGSQKALMIPPGLAFAGVSEKAWRLIEKAKLPRYYFDLARERDSQAKGEVSFTPPISLVVALHQALQYIKELGRERLIANAALLGEATREASRALGLGLLAETSPANALTAVCSPSGIDSGKIIKEMNSAFGTVLANGQGELKGKIFRVAHLGYHDMMDLLGLIGALELCLNRLGHRVECGAGVRAAQSVYLRKQGEAS